MSAYTTVQAGNWSNSATWTGGGGGSIGYPNNSTDTWTVNHAVAVDTNIVSSTGVINAALGLNAGVSFTRLGDTQHGNGVFTMSAGSTLALATSPVSGAPSTVKWILGTVANQPNCKIIINGTIGSHCTILKTGSGYAWFDAGGFGNNGGLESTYCDWSGIFTSDGQLGFGSDDFGLMHRRLLHSTFDNCGVFFIPRPYSWAGSTADKDLRIEDCTFTNPPAASTLNYSYVYLLSAGVGAGTISFLRNSVGDNRGKFSVYLAMGTNAHIDDNYFDSCPYKTDAANASFLRNTIRHSTNNQTLTGGYTSIVDTYFLCDHVDQSDRENGTTFVGNPHVIIVSSSAAIFDGLVIDYPQPLLIDGGDGIYGSPEDGSFAGSVIKNCIVLPSAADGYSGACLHHMISGNTRIQMLHNTVVGKTAQLAFNEANQGSGVSIAQMKSNIVAGVSQSGTQWGTAAYDLFWSAFGGVDIVTPAGIKNNYIYQGVPAGWNDGSGVPSGASTGFHVTQTASPDGTNLFDTVTGPQFVDITRNAATWAAHKGYVVASDLTNNHNRRVALDAARVALMADPTLGHSDLLPWVKAGFAPQNPLLQNAGHDGVTIGAVEFSGGGGPPPPPSGVALVSARHVTVYIP